MAIVNKLPEFVNIFEKWITEEPVYQVVIEATVVTIHSKNPWDTTGKTIVRTYNDLDQSITTGTVASPVQQLPKSVEVGDTLVIRTSVTYIRFYEDLLDPYGWGTLIAEINGVALDPTVQIKIDNDPGTLA